MLEQSGAVAAFLLGFRGGADYDGEVFRLFEAREAGDFLYIDRVVVDAARRGQGLAGLLYDDIAGFARRARIEHLLCEAYETNAVSLRFHAGRGFVAVGRHRLAGTAKMVMLLGLDILI